jgi:hypothetical protein
MPIIELGIPVSPPVEEETALLTYGDFTIKISLTYLHHLRDNWLPTHGPANLYQAADLKFSHALANIERQMWSKVEENAHE